MIGRANKQHTHSVKSVSVKDIRKSSLRMQLCGRGSIYAFPGHAGGRAQALEILVAPSKAQAEALTCLGLGDSRISESFSFRLSCKADSRP